MFTIHEIADRLTELVGEKKFIEAYEQLYAPDAENIDPQNREYCAVKGLNNLLEREKNLLAWTDIHDVSVSKPIVEGNSFTISRSMNYTIMGRCQAEVNELCVYQVKDGKIISQQYFTN
ncbi:MAG TPA: nuclear transport factor 2 family protein [Mucilaginibacter sp.]|jgi:hypothetical protein